MVDLAVARRFVTRYRRLFPTAWFLLAFRRAHAPAHRWTANDHRPADVYVKGPNREAVFVLHCPEGPPDLRDSFGVRVVELNRVREALTVALIALCAEWSKIHGDD